MPTTTSEMPSAWMGYAPRKMAGSPRACVRICAWCPDREQAEALAEAHGYDTTHGLCPACKQKEMAKLTGETLV